MPPQTPLASNGHTPSTSRSTRSSLASSRSALRNYYSSPSSPGTTGSASGLRILSISPRAPCLTSASIQLTHNCRFTQRSAIHLRHVPRTGRPTLPHPDRTAPFSTLAPIRCVCGLPAWLQCREDLPGCLFWVMRANGFYICLMRQSD